MHFRLCTAPTLTAEQEECLFHHISPLSRVVIEKPRHHALHVLEYHSCFLHIIFFVEHFDLERNFGSFRHNRHPAKLPIAEENGAYLEGYSA